MDDMTRILLKRAKKSITNDKMSYLVNLIISNDEDLFVYVDIEFALEIIEMLNEGKTSLEIKETLKNNLFRYFNDKKISNEKERWMNGFAERVLSIAEKLYGYSYEIDKIREEFFHYSLEGIKK